MTNDAAFQGEGKNQISGDAPILNFSVLAVGRPFEVGRVPRPVIFMKRMKFGKSLFCLHHILPCLLFGTHVCRHYVRNPFVAASIRDPTPHSPRRKEGGGGTNTFPPVTFWMGKKLFPLEKSVPFFSFETRMVS